MRVLLLCTDAWGRNGGIALYNRDLATALAAREDCTEVVVVPRLVSAPPGDIPQGVRFIGEAAKGRWQYLKTLIELRLSRFDLVVCSHINLLPVACAFSADPLLMLYGIEAWRPQKKILTNRLVHRASPIVSISQITLDRFLGWSGYEGPTHLLPNAIHRERYGIRPKRGELVTRHGLEGKRVLLTLGRLAGEERYKGFDEVLGVLPQLPPDVVYIIAGDGDDRPRLEASAKRLGLQERVTFTGFVAEEEKADYYSLADVYVMPSRGEGFGYVLLEALASGVPAVGSRLDGGREALRDGELGLLVDPSSPAGIAAAIREALADNGPRRVPEGIDYYSFENFTARLHSIVDQTFVR